MKLYSVTIHRKVIITKYDMKGKNPVQHEELVEQTYHDLPLQTANGYFKIDPKASIFETPSSARSTSKEDYHVSGHSTSARYGKPRTERAAAKAAEAPTPSSDYAAVVNSLMRDSA